MSRPLIRCAALLALAPFASAQSFNIDCDTGGASPTPADSYGGAAGQTGHWTSLQTTTQIEDLNGNMVGVWVLTPPHGPVDFDEACTTGDDQALMDEAHDPGNGSYRISGLIPGDYAIYTYAMAPDDPTYVSDVGVPGSTDPVQSVGGDFCGGHVQGVTYALHHVTTTNGVIFVDVSVNNMFSSVNGFQVVCETCSTGTPLCFGTGGTACPCGNDGSPTSGCANGSGSGAELTATGSSMVANDSVVLNVANAIPSQPGLFFQGDNATNGGDGVSFGDGLRCCGSGVIRLQVSLPDGGGNASSTVPIAATGGVNPGDTKCYQFWYRDPGGSPCGAFFNLSNGYQIGWL